MKLVSDTLKEALKRTTTQRKGRILVNGNYYEVYNVEYCADSYQDGNVIGNAIASQIDFDLPYMSKFDSFKYYDGVWTGNDYEYVDMGTFHVFDEKDQDEFNKHITAFDNLIKFNTPFVADKNYPKTLYEELQNICQQAGVELATNDIANGNFIIENNQFVNNENLKEVLRNICGVSGTYATIKEDKLHLILKTETSEKITKKDHKPMEWKRKTYGINQVILGMADVEGEYVLKQDDDDIAKNGVHKLVINDNYFAYTSQKRLELIEELFEQVKGFGYVPFEMTGEWLNYIDVGDTINIDDVDTIVLRINGKSPKALESIISAPAIIDSAVEYIDNTNDVRSLIKRTEIKVDKANQIIESTVESVADLESSINYFSVELAQNGLTIPTNNNNTPVTSKVYEIPFYGYFKGKQVTPNVSISGSHAGITASSSTTALKFEVKTDTAIAELSNSYEITFTYFYGGANYTTIKNVTIALAPKGTDGTSVNILGSYNSYEELKQAHPTGNIGDAYIIQGNMYVWNVEEQDWVDVGDIQGPAGKPGDNGLTSYLHIKYSEDGVAFTPADDEYALGEKPSAWIGQYVDYTEADSENFDDYKWYKFTEDIDDTLSGMQEDISNNKTNIENTKQDLLEEIDKKANSETVTTIINDVKTLQTSNSQTIQILEEIQTNGVTQVRTENNYTFNKDGLIIEETGAKTKGIFDNKGVDIIDTQGNGNDLLYAGYVDEEKADSNEKLKQFEGQSVVYSDNQYVGNYFMIGTHSRLEDYEDGTGVFYLGG